MAMAPTTSGRTASATGAGASRRGRRPEASASDRQRQAPERGHSATPGSRAGSVLAGRARRARAVTKLAPVTSCDRTGRPPAPATTAIDGVAASGQRHFGTRRRPGRQGRERPSTTAACTTSGCSGSPLISMRWQRWRKPTLGIACAHADPVDRLHRRPAPGARAGRRRRLAHHGALQGARPARDEQARPDAGHRRRPGRRGGDPPHAVAGPLPRRGHRRGAGHDRPQPAALDRRPDRRHQELRPRRARLGHADRAGRRRRGGARRGLGAAAAAPLVGVDGQRRLDRPVAAQGDPVPGLRRTPPRGRLAVLLLAVAAGTSAAGSTTSCR